MAYTQRNVLFDGASANSSTYTSNWVLATYPGAYLYGALKHAAPYLSLGNPNAALTWDTLYTRNTQRIERDSERAEFPMGRLSISLDYATP